MRAAGLHAIATLLNTEAVLIASKPPNSGDDYKHPEHAALISTIKSRIEGVLAANKYVICQYNMPRTGLDVAIKITPGRRAPTITALDNGAWVA
ncbi:ATP phosphoribosyltransferase (ATP-PRTase) (ATP-PRT), partial [Tulasnella sp. 419]